jgi:hypothetical protein
MRFDLDIVCLANSWKHGGRCVAGKIYSGARAGEWVRPVGPDAANRQISFMQMSYGQNLYADVLDIVRISFDGQEANTFQRENLVISNRPWIKLGTIQKNQIVGLLDTPPTLWLNGMSSRFGYNDKIEAAMLTQCRSSLVIIRPNNPRVRIAEEYDSKIKIRILFEYNRQHYALTTTDLWAQETYRERGIGEHALPPVSAMTISLGEKLPNGNSTKIVAQIFKD